MYYYKYTGSYPRNTQGWLIANYTDKGICKRLETVGTAYRFHDAYGKDLVSNHEAMATGVVSTDDPMWIGKRPSPYLLSIHLGDGAHPSLLHELRPKFSTYKWKNRTSGKKRRWEEQKASGDIVFRPYSVGNVEVIRNPGFHESDLSQEAKTWAWYTGDTVSAHYQHWPCTTGNVLAIEGGGMMYNPTPGIQYYADYVRYRVPETSQAIDPYRMTPSLQAAVEEFIAKLQVPKPIPGLVTSVQCEASKGAWNALTSVMETARETLPMMLRSAVQALELYQLARGKISERMKRSPGPIPPPPRRKDKYQLVYRESLQKETLREDIASIWLWYRYAVQPIAMDLAAMQEFLQRSFKEYRSYRQGRKHTLEFEHEGWTGSVIAQDRCLVRHEYGFSYFDGMMVNPFLTAWEMLPTRIITDWFVNVGDILASQKSPSNLKQTKMSYSTRVNDVLVLTHPGFTGSVEIRIDSYTRGHNTNLSYIDLEFRNNVTWKRFIDALAIFWGGKKVALRYR